MFTNTPATSTPSWDALPTPRDGDDLDQAGFLPLVQGIANRDKYILRAVAPQYIHIPVIGHPKEDIYSSSVRYWRDDLAGMYAVTDGSANNPTTTALMTIPLNRYLPQYCTITELRLSIVNYNVYTQTPANKLQMSFISRANSDVAPTVIATGTDPGTFGGSPSMNAFRHVTITMAGQLIDTSATTYGLKIASEYGAGAWKLTGVYGLRATIVQPGV